MYNLQKPTAIKFLSVVFLAAIACQIAYSQKFGQPAPPSFKKCWEYATNKLTDFNFASDNTNTLYVALLDGKLISIDMISGERGWETELGGEIVSAPVVVEDNVYLAVRYALGPSDESLPGNNSLIVRSLNKLTGLTHWKVNLTNEFYSAEKVYLYGYENNLIAVSESGEVYSIDKNNGRIVWKKKLSTKLSAAPFVKDRRVFAATLDHRIVNVSVIDGRLIEEWKTPVPPATLVEDRNGGNLIWGDGKGSLTSLGQKSKTSNWKFRNGARISSITLTGRGLLVASFDNFIYLISEINGKMLWKRILNGRISDEPQVNKDYFIITATDDLFAHVIDLNTGKLLNRIPLENDNFFVGESIRSGDYYVYATRKGIISFSDDDGGCASPGGGADGIGK
jgi:outer membrane protein assembly factor BamB